MDNNKHESTDVPIKDEYRSVRSLVNDMLRMRRESTIVFRGVRELYQLNPQIQRYWYREKVINLSSLEHQMLYDFYMLRDPNQLSLKNDILDIVASAQHYGLPTRFIDWTRDPFVALFFASSRLDVNNPKPFYVYYTDLNDHTVLDSLIFYNTWGDLGESTDAILNFNKFIKTISNNEELEKLINSRRDKLCALNVQSKNQFRRDGLIFYDAPLTNNRMLAQKGLFSIPNSLDFDMPRQQIAQYTNKCEVILDTKELKELKKYLENMEYTNYHLFPELESRCMYITEKAVDKVQG